MRNSLFLVRDIERAPSCFVCVKTYFRSKTVLHFRTLFFFANTHCRQHTHTRTHNTGTLAREATRCGLDDTPPLFLRRDLEQKLVDGAEGPSGQLMYRTRRTVRRLAEDRDASGTSARPWSSLFCDTLSGLLLDELDT